MNSAVAPLAFTVRECAAALRCSERTIRRAISSGRLRAIRIGSLLRVPADALRQFVEDAQTNDSESNSTVRANGKTEAKLKENGNESDTIILGTALKRAVEDAVLPAFEEWQREQTEAVRP